MWPQPRSLALDSSINLAARGAAPTSCERDGSDAPQINNVLRLGLDFSAMRRFGTVNQLIQHESREPGARPGVKPPFEST
jgi:hypothetical protein